ncbi:MAG: sigma factor [Lachnospiraceae bacterium]|nr:sigma factor [Lachnospiraceae bacterium]
MKKWSNQYYRLLYVYVYQITSSSSLAEEITKETLLRAYERSDKLKGEPETGNWMIRTARYLILKEVYSSWERGEDIHEKYDLPDIVDPSAMKSIIEQYEENE